MLSIKILAMPSYRWVNETGPVASKHMWDGHGFARAAVEFAAMAWAAEQSGTKFFSRLHLCALAIELGFKSLALRAGATPDDCLKARHRITEMVRLVEKLGVIVPTDIKRQLNDDGWFKKMLGSRYPIHIANPTLEDTLCFHSNYPEIIAGVLEIPCPCPLAFEGGSALAEIRMLKDRIRSIGAEVKPGPF